VFTFVFAMIFYLIYFFQKKKKKKKKKNFYFFSTEEPHVLMKETLLIYLTICLFHLIQALTLLLSPLEFILEAFENFNDNEEERNSEEEERNSEEEKKIVIIGGGFAGLAACRALRNRNVTLIDSKEYFEYTPGILKNFVDRWTTLSLHIKFETLCQKRAYKGLKFKRCSITSIENGVAKSETGEVFPFDYLIIAPGRGYKAPIASIETTEEKRKRTFQSVNEQLKRSTSVVVAGG